MTAADEVTLRDATEEDRPVVERLTLRAYAEYSGVMEPQAWRGLEQAIRRALSSVGDEERIVAESAGKVVGAVMLYPPGVNVYGDMLGPLDWPEVRLLAVDPDARGQGIAHLLMEECVRRARAAGTERLGIHTSRSMEVAVGMYRRMGFERAPAHDFHPPGAERVEAYTLALS